MNSGTLTPFPSKYEAVTSQEVKEMGFEVVRLGRKSSVVGEKDLLGMIPCIP